MKVGDRIKKAYPFRYFESEGDELFSGCFYWLMGCHKTFEQYSESEGETFYNADGEGFIDIEILAIIDMPRRMKQRVIYKFDQICPDESIKKSSRTYTVTIDKFNELITGNAYWHEYELIKD